MKAARNVQSVLLLREAPDIEGLDIAIRLRAAREITGDVYDIFEHGADYTVFTFGDVSGKGAAAALVRRHGQRPAPHARTSAAAVRPTFLSLLNKVLRERIVEAQYVTLMVVVWERAKQRFVMANAGAEPPMMCRHGEILKPRVEGVPAGLLDNREYDEELIVGSRARRLDCALFGRHHRSTESQGRRIWTGPPDPGAAAAVRQVLRKLVADPDSGRSGRIRRRPPTFDDQTLIVLKVR